MTPAEEKARLAMVQLGLEKLVSGGPQTRIEMFGEASTDSVRAFQRNVLRTLELSGVVYKADTGTPPTSRVHLKNRTKATRLLENPIELAQLVWPGSKPPPPPELVLPKGEAPQEPIVLVIDEESAPQEQATFVTIKKAAVATTPKGPPQKQVPEVVQVPAPVLAPVPAPPQVDADQLAATNQLLERLLVIMDAACQSIIYTREKLDSLEPKINYLWEQLK